MARNPSDDTALPDVPAPGEEAERALYELLVALYAAGGLDRLARHALGAAIAAELPDASAGLAALAHKLVVSARANGWLDALFAALERERPGQVERIRAVAALFASDSPFVPSARRVSSRWSSTSPDYPDAMTERLSAELSDAYRRRDTLHSLGEDTAGIFSDILALRRQLREGGRLEPGDYLGDGRYALLEKLGEGGFGAVFRALDQRVGEQVAIKVLHPRLARDTIRRERFFRGARAMAKLDHEAIVRVREPHGEDGGYHYFTMELIRGDNLHDAVIDGRVDAEQAIPIILAIGDALAAAHRAGFVHRDVKPGNVLVTEDGPPKLTDFDLVGAGDTTGGTRTGMMGTFLYAAPEMMERPQDADARADVYGLGMTAIFALRGEPLPQTVIRNVNPILHRLPCRLTTKRVLRRAVDWNVAARYPTIEAFCEALSRSVATASALAVFNRGHVQLEFFVGASPRDADIAFTSIDSSGAPGELSMLTLSSLDGCSDHLPSQIELEQGFVVKHSPAGVPVVFIVTVDWLLDTALLLERNLCRALDALSERIQGKTLWIPLMGTGAGRLAMQESLSLTIVALFDAGLHIGEETTRVVLAVPPELSHTFVQKLCVWTGVLVNGYR